MAFLVEWHQAKFASPNTSILLSNWVHGHLQVIRWYLIVHRATLQRAVRPCVRGEAIFRINSLTEYKRSGLSIANKFNLAATLWNSFNTSPVRRSSSSLTSSGGSCHFAVPRNSVNFKVFKMRETCCWSDSYSTLDVAMSAFSQKKKSLSETVTTRGPELQLCSARMHFGANSVHAFAPHVDPQ